MFIDLAPNRSLPSNWKVKSGVVGIVLFAASALDFSSTSCAHYKLITDYDEIVRHERSTIWRSS